MIELPSLYPHQQEQIQKLRKAFCKDDAVILQAPCGFGKSRCAKWMLGSYANRERRDNESGFALVCVHRRGLVENMSQSFLEDPPLDHGVIMSGREMWGGKQIQVASIDTLLSWYVDGKDYLTEQTFDFVTFDEAHSHNEKLKTYLAAHNAKRRQLGLRDPFVLGLTATPMSQGLEQLFKQIVQGPTTRWMTENGFLCPFRYFAATQGKLELLVKRGDEFTKDSVSDAMEGMSGDLVRDWKKYSGGVPTVGFFARLSHAKEAQQLLIENGVRCEYLDGSTPDEERREIFAKLNNAEIDYLANVGVVERGTDIPRIGCVQLCTAVGSVVRFLQMVGRGSRTHPDKQACVLIDHGSNIKRHGLFDDPIQWTLDWSKRPAKEHTARPVIECPECGAQYRGGLCRRCGYEPTQRQRKEQGLTWDGEELQEVKSRDRKPKTEKSSEQIIISSLYMAGKSGRTFRQALGMAFGIGKQQTSPFKVPARFTVAGRTYMPIPRGHADANRRVSQTYGFTMGDHSSEANPYQL